MRGIPLFVAGLALVLLVACIVRGDARVPMNSLEDRLHGTEGPRARTLIVFMQGAYSTPEDYLSHGFVAAVRHRHIEADILMADTNFAYVAEGSLVTRLHEDVIGPALAQGYSELWLVGISLGAYSALAYASEHEDKVRGLFLISPYPGTQDVLRPIRDAGSLGQWLKKPDSSKDDGEHRIWRWLAAWQGRGQPPEIWMSTGDMDRFLSGQRMIGELLPPEQVRYLPGAHTWEFWEKARQDFLDRGVLNR